MPLKIGDLFNQTAKRISGGEKSILTNMIWVAAIIVGVLLLTLWFILKNEVDIRYDDTSLIMLLLKGGVWSFITCLLVIFLHDNAIKTHYENLYRNKNQEQIIDRVITNEKGIEPEIVQNQSSMSIL